MCRRSIKFSSFNSHSICLRHPFRCSQSHQICPLSLTLHLDILSSVAIVGRLLVQMVVIPLAIYDILHLEFRDQGVQTHWLCEGQLMLYLCLRRHWRHYSRVVQSSTGYHRFISFISCFLLLRKKSSLITSLIHNNGSGRHSWRVYLRSVNLLVSRVYLQWFQRDLIIIPLLSFFLTRNLPSNVSSTHHITSFILNIVTHCLVFIKHHVMHSYNFYFLLIINNKR